MSDTAPSPFPAGVPMPTSGEADAARTPAGDPHGEAAEGGRPPRRTRVLLLVTGVLVVVLAAGSAGALVLLSAAGDGPASDTAGPADPTAPGPTAGPGGSPSPAGTDAGPAGGDSVPATPLLDGASVARNVFAPLVDTGAGGAAAGESAGPAGEAAVPTDAALPVPSVVAPPAPATVTVPGPTVTEFSVVTQTVPGPTATQVVTETYSYTVTVASLADAAVDDTAVTFTVNGASAAVAVGGTFGPGGALTYVDYAAGSGLVTFAFGSSQVVTPVGRTVAFP